MQWASTIFKPLHSQGFMENLKLDADKHENPPRVHNAEGEESIKHAIYSV